MTARGRCSHVPVNAVAVVPVAGSTCTATGLDPATEYSVQVMKVVDGGGVAAKPSPVIAVATAAVPEPALTRRACETHNAQVSMALQGCG